MPKLNTASRDHFVLCDSLTSAPLPSASSTSLSASPRARAPGNSNEVSSSLFFAFMFRAACKSTAVAEGEGSTVLVDGAVELRDPKVDTRGTSRLDIVWLCRYCCSCESIAVDVLLIVEGGVLERVEMTSADQRKVSIYIR
jgi:hypothetical protein